MDARGAASLREAAPNWSLAGDQLLLDMLQSIHQNIVTRCEETNGQLDAMVAALDDADICLQNVNNKFMALSSSQFVESRVYEDDADIAATKPEPPVKENTIPHESESELSRLRSSLLVLESYHEAVRIDDDSDSDMDGYDDDKQRLVLKPRDLYSERPLPYIIGSYAWKTKWHAGLQPEDSDSDSSTSKPDRREAEQYSQSESESERSRACTPDRTGAREGDSLSVPLRGESAASSERSEADLSPAAVAAELARRLGGVPPMQPPEFEPDPAADASTPVIRKVYRPEKPSQSTIFSDEPPPLDDTNQSEDDYYSQSDNDDIFAELHKNKPNDNRNKENSRVADDLFAGLNQNGAKNNSNNVEDDLFGRVIKSVPYGDVSKNANNAKEKAATNAAVKRTPTLFADDSEPELFVEKAQTHDIENTNSKKPVGGISLFGSNQGTESIGAAILKRNQRKSSSSEEETVKSVNKVKTEETAARNINKAAIDTETAQKDENEQKDIIDGLFTKSGIKTQKNTNNKIQANQIPKPKSVEAGTNKTNIFSDNLFDDIDDIFTSNIVTNVTIKQASKNDKSIFDDDDDLFADIAISKPIKKENKPKSDCETTKTIFDSDEGLFIEKHDKKEPANVQSQKLQNEPPENSVKKDILKEKSLFDDMSDDDLFSDIKISNIKENYEEESISDSNITSKKSVSKSLLEEPKFVVEDRNSINKSITNMNNSVATNIEKTPQHQDSQIEKSYLSKSNQKVTLSTHTFKNSSDDEPDILFATSKPRDPSINTIKTEEIIRTTKIISDHEIPPDVTNARENKEAVPKSIDIAVETPVNDFENVLSQFKDSPPTLLPENNPCEDTTFLAATMNASNTDKTYNTYEDEWGDKLLKHNKNDPIVTGNIDENVPRMPNESLNETTIKTALDNNKNVDTNKNLTEALFSQVLSSNSDVFSDIFTDLPPAFEKPKEPKKSKNVNALFDDDSDDESLFFKKNDTVVDENPDDLPSSSSNTLFGLFHDEPPDVGVDFTQKSNMNDENDNLTGTNFTNKDIFQTGKGFSEVYNNESERSDTPPRSKEESKYNADIPDGSLQIQDNEVRKSVGKLKRMNFNINVNTLLPGALPKKTPKSPESLERLTLLDNDNLDLKDSIIKPEIAKSVSFEGKINSEVLDNKVSKERAKIQVRRRPSTRKARREAVRISAIDFGEDSTDNSSSNVTIEERDNVLNTESIVQRTIQQVEKIESTDVGSVTAANFLPKTEPPTFRVSNEKTTKTVYILNDEDIFNVKSEHNNDPIKSIPSLENIGRNSETKLAEEVVEKPKTLLIEDRGELFKNNMLDSESKVSKNVQKLKFGDGDENSLFKNTTTTENIPHKEPGGIQTLGKVYIESKPIIYNDNDSTKNNEPNKRKETKKNLFYDLSDDESDLFGGGKKQITKKQTTSDNKTKNLFNSDSDEELFGNKRKMKADVNKKEVTRSKAKGSLFGDDEDDDLFGIQTKKSDKTSAAPSKKETSKQKDTQAVFEDPLSLLNEDD